MELVGQPSPGDVPCRLGLGSAGWEPEPGGGSWRRGWGSESPREIVMEVLFSEGWAKLAITTMMPPSEQWCLTVNQVSSAKTSCVKESSRRHSNVSETQPLSQAPGQACALQVLPGVLLSLRWSAFSFSSYYAVD